MGDDTAANKENGKPVTLGVLLSHFGSYQEAIWNGIAQIAEEYDANVICIIGGDLNSRIGFQKHWNVIYELAKSPHFDGLIIPSAALQNFATPKEIGQFCARYAPLPMISIALELDNIPSITVDNPSGLNEMMCHLIEHHHYKRIAFIQGSENNPEAKARYAAYLKGLEDHGIPFDPDLVAPGNFYYEAGAEAVKLFLDQRQVSFDVIVASNDAMAMGVWQELNKRGVNIPVDVAITGFDDIPEARIFATPLTTVRQPLVEQGRQAARMLLEYLFHGISPQNKVLGTELVIRESCGCSSLMTANLAALTPAVTANISTCCAFTQQRDAVLASVQGVLGPHFPGLPPQSVELLVVSFFDALQGQPTSQFLTLFSRLLWLGTMNLSRIELDEGVMAQWQEVLSILRRDALPYKQAGVTTDIDGLLHQGRILVTNATEHLHSNLRGRAEASMLVQSEVIRDINAAPDTQRMVDALAQSLPHLGIRTCALALYEGQPIPPPTSRLIMAYHNEEKAKLGPDGRLFPTIQLIPDDMLPDQKLPFLVIHPLVVRDIHFGFIVMQMLIGHRIMYNTYEEFAEQIGSVLHRALLLQQIERSNESLQQRAAELAEVNAQLEQFVYAASHDLQEPLRMISSYLQLLERRYRDKLDSDAQEFIAYAVDGATRMKRMINDLLAYSRVVTRGHSFEPVDCEYLLAQVLSNLEIAIKENEAQITHTPLPTVMGDSTQLMEVFQNLIGNAIKFHADQQPHVHITAERTEDKWLFSVRDNGIGIAPEYIERIFAIFSRLHSQARYPGSGIGLAICKKVVERHGGQIWAESQPEEGTTFFFTIQTEGGGV